MPKLKEQCVKIIAQLSQMAESNHYAGQMLQETTPQISGWRRLTARSIRAQQMQQLHGAVKIIKDISQGGTVDTTRLKSVKETILSIRSQITDEQLSKPHSKVFGKSNLDAICAMLQETLVKPEEALAHKQQQWHKFLPVPLVQFRKLCQSYGVKMEFNHNNPVEHSLSIDLNQIIQHVSSALFSFTQTGSPHLSEEENEQNKSLNDLITTLKTAISISCISSNLI